MSVPRVARSRNAAGKGVGMSTKDKPPAGVNFNRRNFLKSAGVAGLADTIVAHGEAAEQSGAVAVGPGETPVRLNVNGKEINLMIEPRVTLLDALRMRANLTGNKRGCDRGACGACTMIVDGRHGLLLFDAGD